MIPEEIMLTVTQKHEVIDSTIGKMSELELASVKYFLETLSVNGSFRERLYEIIAKTTEIVIKEFSLTQSKETKGGVLELVEVYEKFKKDFPTAAEYSGLFAAWIGQRYKLIPIESTIEDKGGVKEEGELPTK